MVLSLCCGHSGLGGKTGLASSAAPVLSDPSKSLSALSSLSLILHIPGTARMGLEGSFYILNVGQSWEVEAVLMVDGSFKKYVGGFVVCVSVSNICMCISVSVWVVQSWMDVCASVYLYIDIVVCVCVYFHVCVSVFLCVYMYVFQYLHRQVWIAQRWSKC